MSFSNRTAKGLLDSFFAKTSVFGALATAPQIFVGLSSTTPSETGTGVTEPSGGAYARKSTVAADWATATSADPSVILNANAITFVQASADWLVGANLTHVVLYDAVTAGNYLGFGTITTPKPVLNGDTAEIAAGQISISLD